MIERINLADTIPASEDLRREMHDRLRDVVPWKFYDRMDDNGVMVPGSLWGTEYSRPVARWPE